MDKEYVRLDPGKDRHENGFTLVELLVVVSIVIALAAVSVVSVLAFAGKGDEGASAAEVDNIQAAMDTAMADAGLSAVTGNQPGAGTGDGVNDFTSLPVEVSLTVGVQR